MEVDPEAEDMVAAVALAEAEEVAVEADVAEAVVDEAEAATCKNYA